MKILLDYLKLDRKQYDYYKTQEFVEKYHVLEEFRNKHGGGWPYEYNVVYEKNTWKVKTAKDSSKRKEHSYLERCLGFGSRKNALKLIKTHGVLLSEVREFIEGKTTISLFKEEKRKMIVLLKRLLNRLLYVSCGFGIALFLTTYIDLW